MPKKSSKLDPIGKVPADTEPSPYTSPICTVRIGPDNDDYKISRSFLPQSLISLISPSWGSSIDGLIALPKLDKDVGHTLIHYLHAHVYQTLGTSESTPKIEYRRSVLLYSTAVKYQIEGLATTARQEMEKYDGVVTIVDIVAACRDTYKNSPENDPWLLRYLQVRLEAALREDDTVFYQDQFLDQVGGPEEFSKMIFRTVVEIYAGKRLTLPDLASEAERGPKPNGTQGGEKLIEWPR